ncbi:MAG: hypothetical protein ACTHK4_01670 [Mycobacteriales bacterium]
MSDFFGPDMGPESMFGGLDDPTPPAFGNELLPGVVQRGQHIRRQRRIAYGIGSACAALMIAGGAVGIASVSGNSSPSAPELHVPTTPAHTKHPHHHGQSPGTVGSRQGPGRGTTHTGGQPCVSPTPSSSESPTPTASPTDAGQATPMATDSAVSYRQTAPAPSDTGCASPSPTDSGTAAPTDSPTPSFSSIPPVL